MRYIWFYSYLVHYNYILTLLLMQVAFIVECIIRKFYVVCVCTVEHILKDILNKGCNNSVVPTGSRQSIFTSERGKFLCNSKIWPKSAGPKSRGFTATSKFNKMVYQYSSTLSYQYFEEHCMDEKQIIMPMCSYVPLQEP